MNVKFRAWISWILSFGFLLSVIDPDGFFGFIAVLVLSGFLTYFVTMFLLWMEFALRFYLVHRKKP